MANRVDIIQCQVYDNKSEGILGDTIDLDNINKTVLRLIGNTVFGNGYFGISCGTTKSIWIQVYII